MANAHAQALGEAWREFREGVTYRFWDLSEDFDGNPTMPKPLAALCAPWRPLAYRFRRYNLEKLFRPLKAERRQMAWDRQNYIFVCGGSDLSEADWDETAALSAEFGVDMPPRDWEPFTVAETVGTIMGFTREEVAEIVSTTRLPEEPNPC